MLRRNRVRDDRGTRVEHAPRARGGVSVGGVLTGVVVAFGAIFLLSALIGGVVAASGFADENVTGGDVVDAGIAGGIAFVVAQFLAYMWGGYTAGRMARGAGLVNGLLVPLAGILIALLVGGIAAAMGAASEMNLPLQDARLPLEQDVAIDFGVGLGIAALVVAFVGGALGGALGARWHGKLERRAVDEVEGRHLTERRPARTDESRTDESSGGSSERPRGAAHDDAAARRRNR